MPHRCSRPRPVPSRPVPPASAPLRDPADAVAVLAAVASRPLRPEIVVLVLDRARCGGPVVVVDGAAPGSELVVVDTLARLADRMPEVEALVVASVRPGGGVLDEDQFHWLALLERAELAGLVLVDWFVLDGRTATSLAALTGSPDRW